ncbi:MAG: trehalose-phosphatase [Candidatus Bipolaricaulota bacterium]|nr:MAG: trehalose-phosphatase [Candidatus Bipolaricaulota bacterium]
MTKTRSELPFDAAVFDLDGVITLTAGVHALAWKRLFDPVLEAVAAERGEPLVPFDLDRDYLNYVDGKPRIEGVKSFLASRGIDLVEGSPDDPPEGDTAWALGNRKNGYFRAALDEKGVEVDDDTVAIIHELRARGVRVAVASSSKNCEPILDRAGLAELFEARVDGLVSEELGLKGKPDPDIFVEAARRVDAEPSRALVVEDAISGVAAGRAGGFGLVIGIDRHAGGVLRHHGADLVIACFAETSLGTLAAWFSQRAHRRPSALEDEALHARLRSEKPAVFLDYDGTLTPIVSRPEFAVLSEEMRSTVERVAAACPTSIVSGRGRDDVAALVGIPELVVAGSHGFDIVGPEGLELRLDIADEAQPLIAELVTGFRAATADVDGAIVEDKRFSLAVHYRLVADEEVPALEAMVDAAAAAHPQLRKTLGKKVFELRPDIDWDKGKALLWLLEALDLERDDVLPLYIGDDVTDEDAFAAIADRGVGILVSDAPRPTAAQYWLQNTREVGAFLDRLASAAEASS